MNFILKLTDILKCIKVLKIIKFEFSVYGRGYIVCRHLDDALFRPTCTLLFAEQ